MELAGAQYDDFIEERNKAAEALGIKTLTNNPNVTYGQILSPQELGSAAIILNKELNARATEIFDQDMLNQIQTSVDFENRVKPYNKVPSNPY